ncbi:MAG: hypothetical protein CVT49_03990 [candidate division Zixibacteria bacterium HGW-Zixibacteria-1]|nr:MAG: hypothetical protein CVT49_03990 [candidate division Zixibacteria bacterium HGW-Zixibacteria-1]
MLRNRLLRVAEYLALNLGIWKLFYSISGIFMRRKMLVVFTFHRVTSKEKSQKYLMGYDRGMDHKSFEKQIRAFKKYYDIIGLDDFIAIIQGKKKPANHSALLTFDDADSDFALFAQPIMEKYGCESVNFAPTDFIESDKRFWHLRISNIFHNLDQEGWDHLWNNSEGLPSDFRSLIERSTISSEKDKVSTCRSFMLYLRDKSVAERTAIVDRLVEITGYDYTLGIQCMTWTEMARMEKKGVRIESHTASHRELSRLDRESIKTELAESQKTIQGKLGKTARTICYPAGSYNDDVLDVLMESNYIAGFSSRHGTCRYPLNGKELFMIPRFGAHGEDICEIHGYLGKILIKRLLKGQ